MIIINWSKISCQEVSIIVEFSYFRFFFVHWWKLWTCNKVVLLIVLDWIVRQKPREIFLSYNFLPHDGEGLVFSPLTDGNTDRQRAALWWQHSRPKTRPVMATLMNSQGTALCWQHGSLRNNPLIATLTTSEQSCDNNTDGQGTALCWQHWQP